MHIRKCILKFWQKPLKVIEKSEKKMPNRFLSIDTVSVFTTFQFIVRQAHNKIF